MYWTQVIVQPKAGGEPVHTSVTEVPDDVEFDSLLGYYTELLGEPYEAAYADVEELGRVDVGWVFEVPQSFDLSGVRHEYEFVVVPLIEDPDDPEALISAGVHMAQLRAHLVDLVEPDVIVLPE